MPLKNNNTAIRDPATWKQKRRATDFFFFPHSCFVFFVCLFLFSETVCLVLQVFISIKQHCGVADLARLSEVSEQCQPACQMVGALQGVKSTVSCINRQCSTDTQIHKCMPESINTHTVAQTYTVSVSLQPVGGRCHKCFFRQRKSLLYLCM